MKKFLFFVAVYMATSIARADIVIDSLNRMIFTPVLNEQNESSPLTGIELHYQNGTLQSTMPFRIYQQNMATWFKWTNVPSTRSFSVDYRGFVRMGDFNATTSYGVTTPRMLTLHNSSGVGLQIEQNNANAAINVHVNDTGAYIIKAEKPLFWMDDKVVMYSTVFSVDAAGMVYNANSQLTLSDKSHKRDITAVTDALDGLRAVKPVSYILTSGEEREDKSGNTVYTMQRNRGVSAEDVAEEGEYQPDTVVNETPDPTVQTAMDAERARPKYGFVAQEIEEIFPNVVYTMPNGEKAIAYQEIIPLLVSAFQEQQNMIDSLSNRIEELENPGAEQRRQAPAALQEAMADGTAALMQNTPNPFNQATEIGYRLPEGTATAMIMLCDMNGKMLQSYPLSVGTASGTLTIQAGSYTPGMYLYTLLIDGVQIDTKQMIILAH